MFKLNNASPVIVIAILVVFVICFVADSQVSEAQESVSLIGRPVSVQLNVKITEKDAGAGSSNIGKWYTYDGTLRKITDDYVLLERISSSENMPGYYKLIPYDVIKEVNIKKP